MRMFPRCYRVFMHVWAPCILGAIPRDWKLDRRMNYGFRKCRGYVEMRCFGRLTVDKKFGSMTCVILLHFLTNNETF